jgi:hypothetical protein
VVSRHEDSTRRRAAHEIDLCFQVPDFLVVVGVRRLVQPVPVDIVAQVYDDGLGSGRQLQNLVSDMPQHGISRLGVAGVPDQVDDGFDFGGPGRDRRRIRETGRPAARRHDCADRHGRSTNARRSTRVLETRVRFRVLHWLAGQIGAAAGHEQGSSALTLLALPYRMGLAAHASKIELRNER